MRVTRSPPSCRGGTRKVALPPDHVVTARPRRPHTAARPSGRPAGSVSRPGGTSAPGVGSVAPTEEVYMSRATRARRIAATAAFGGGGLGALAAGRVRGDQGRSWVSPGAGSASRSATTAPAATASTAPAAGEPIVFAMLGDSSSVGLGVDDPSQTPGAVMAAGLAAITGRPVRLRTVGIVGAESSGPARPGRPSCSPSCPAPDVAVIMVGANDVTHRVPPGRRRPRAGRRRPPAARDRLRGRRRHLPRPRHDRAAALPAELGTRPALGRAARGRPDDRDRRGRRADGVARRPARPGVLRPAQGAVQRRPLPPLRRRVRARGGHHAAQRRGGARVLAGGRSPSSPRHAAAASGSTTSRNAAVASGRGGRHRGVRARRSTAPSAAPAAGGPCCCGAGGRRSPPRAFPAPRTSRRPASWSCRTRRTRAYRRTSRASAPTVAGTTAREDDADLPAR